MAMKTIGWGSLGNRDGVGGKTETVTPRNNSGGTMPKARAASPRGQACRYRLVGNVALAPTSARRQRLRLTAIGEALARLGALVRPEAP